MKKALFLLLVFISTLLVSCSSGNDVVSKGVISKRKYRTGWNVDLVKKHRFDRGDNSNEIALKPHTSGVGESEEDIQEVAVNAAKKTQLVQTKIEQDQHSKSGSKEGKKETQPKALMRLKNKVSKHLVKAAQPESFIPTDGIEKDSGGDSDNYSYITLGGIATMIFTLGWIPFFNVLIALALLVTGILALAKGQNRALAIFAFISSILFLLLCIGWSLIFVVFLAI